MSGKPWYNNGIKEKQFGSNDIIPDDFTRGRLIRSQQQIDIANAKRKITNSAKSDEEKLAINNKRSNTLKNTMANKSDEEKKQAIEKRKATNANKSDEEKAAYSAKLSKSLKGKNKGKEPWNKNLTKETDERVAINAEHTRQSMIHKVAEIKAIDPEYYNKWRRSINDVMRENNTFNSSSAEEKYYDKLIGQYGENNVIRQYWDERYPYVCDFYIPSEDLFIELNKHWTHGKHPFDPFNLSDISKLEDWEERANSNKYYANAVYVWTKLDPRKQLTAKQNNLNYKVIY